MRTAHRSQMLDPVSSVDARTGRPATTLVEHPTFGRAQVVSHGDTKVAIRSTYAHAATTQSGSILAIDIARSWATRAAAPADATGPYTILQRGAFALARVSDGDGATPRAVGRVRVPRLTAALAIDPENPRAGLLALVLRVSAILGGAVYVPSVVFALGQRLYSVVAIATIAIAAVIALWRAPRLPFRTRAVGFCLIVYALAVGLLVTVGSISQIYLFAFSVFAVLLLGRRATARDGRTIRCEWHNTPLFDEHGAFTGILSLAQDVSDRTHLERRSCGRPRRRPTSRSPGGARVKVAGAMGPGQMSGATATFLAEATTDDNGTAVLDVLDMRVELLAETGWRRHDVVADPKLPGDDDRGVHTDVELRMLRDEPQDGGIGGELALGHADHRAALGRGSDPQLHLADLQGFADPGLLDRDVGGCVDHQVRPEPSLVEPCAWELVAQPGERARGEQVHRPRIEVRRAALAREQYLPIEHRGERRMNARIEAAHHAAVGKGDLGSVVPVHGAKPK